MESTEMVRQEAANQRGKTKKEPFALDDEIQESTVDTMQRH